LRVTGVSKHDLFRSFFFLFKKKKENFGTGRRQCHDPPFYVVVVVFVPTQSSFVFVFLFVFLLLSFLGKVVFLAALCPVSLSFLLLFLCLVRSDQQQKRWTITLSPFLYLCRVAQSNGWVRRKPDKTHTHTQKRERLSQTGKHTENVAAGDGCGRGRLGWRSSFSTSYSLSLHDGPARVVPPVAITPTHLTGSSSSSLPFHSSKLGLLT
jgi:hypothetical protein